MFIRIYVYVCVRIISCVKETSFKFNFTCHSLIVLRPVVLNPGCTCVCPRPRNPKPFASYLQSTYFLFEKDRNREEIKNLRVLKVPPKRPFSVSLSLLSLQGNL